MIATKRLWSLIVLILLLLGLPACAAAEPELILETVVVEQPGETTVETIVETVELESGVVATVIVTVPPAAEEPVTAETAFPEPQATATQAALPTAAPTLILPTPTPGLQPSPIALVEGRLVEVEWPGRLYLGDSDVVRLALIPTEGGYELTTEFPDHQVLTQNVPVVRPPGYELFAVGRLDGVGFTISPAAEQVRNLPLDEAVVWHWSLTPEQPGKQRLTILLLLRWVPLAGTPGTTREAVAYSRGLDVHVNSFFGLNRGQALTTTLLGLLLGAAFSLLAVFYRPGRGSLRLSGRLTASQLRTPRPDLVIERPAGLFLNDTEEQLLRALFNRYQRLLIKQEFLSGYSGARTFLLIPVRPDGRADAATIGKLGGRQAIEREYANYETFVKHTLPPVTARIQSPPVTRRGAERAALQYTFIGQPGSNPTSLGQALRHAPDPAYLYKLVETFGPNWWLQRSAWTFRLAQEYDHLLPPHLVLEPAPGTGRVLDGRQPPGELAVTNGALLNLRHFQPKPGGSPPGRDYYSLVGEAQPGQPPLRVHWLGSEPRRGQAGRVVATRLDLLRSYVTGFDLRGWPDPLAALEAILNETIQGSRAIIHGDLNLENVLVGPGGLVWLIDFANTREGHPLADFAHLQAEIIAHLLAGQIDPQQYRALLTEDVTVSPEQAALFGLTTTVERLAGKCLYDPAQRREYQLALYLACLGALKYRNLQRDQKYLLYLTAARQLDLLKVSRPGGKN